MPNIPGYAWPEAVCYLSGSTLHVGQVRWKQLGTFLPLVAPAKWMVIVRIDNVIVYGQTPAAGPSTATYAAELPLTQTSVAIDLSAHGVHSSHPLSPKVTVDQWAGTSTGASGWRWAGTNWEDQAVQYRIHIDSNAGVPKRATHQYEEPVDTWNPLANGFYDEGAPPWDSEDPTDPVAGVWETFLTQPPLGSMDGSAGFQFQAVLPACSIRGVQVWIPPYELDETSRPGTPYVRHGVGEPFIVRVWEGDPATGTGNNNVVAYQEVDNPQPGWNNILFDPGDVVDAKTTLIPGTPGTGNPFPYVTNPDHDGQYTVGFQQILGANFRGPDEISYLPLLPKHTKVFMHDNFPANSQLLNWLHPTAQKGPEWAPQFGETSYLFVGPIITYAPIYPVPKGFRPQIYRRVVTETH